MIKERTEGEKKAYIQGYRAAMKELVELITKMEVAVNLTESTIVKDIVSDSSSK